MKFTDEQKERCAAALAEVEWKQLFGRPALIDPVWTWETLPESLRRIRLAAARKHLEPIWPILEGEQP